MNNYVVVATYQGIDQAMTCVIKAESQQDAVDQALLTPYVGEIVAVSDGVLLDDGLSSLPYWGWLCEVEVPKTVKVTRRRLEL